MNIGFKWVLWIYCHKGLRYVTANNRVPCKLQLDLVAVRLIHYSRFDFLYFYIKFEGTPFLGLWNKFNFILKYIFDHTSPHQMELSRDIICIIWEFSCRCLPVENLLADVWESKISTENIGEGIRSNVYSLSAIRSFAGFPKRLLFLFTFVEVIPNWRVRKWVFLVLRQYEVETPYQNFRNLTTLVPITLPYGRII